jgi:ATP-dependent DNA helicase UvrD/PcrA
MRGGAAISAYSPGQLARLLGLPEPTPEQAAVIAAPLEPMVVAAGAGSGKSETMAARVVWLVANGLVRPERVLGLTFTRKAAGELSERVRRRLDGLRRAGLSWEKTGRDAANPAPPAAPAGGAAPQGPGERPPDGDDDPLAGEPTVCTYHAYAGRLVADHALREAVEPSLRLITPAVQWQIAAKVTAGYEGPVDKITWTPASVTAAVLELAGELAEHLRTPEDVRAVGEGLARQAAALSQRAAAGSRAGRDGRPSAAAKKILATQEIREQLLPIVTAFGAAKAAREVIDFGDQIELAARIAVRHAAAGAAERGRYHVVLLDEYQDTSHAQLVLLRALFGGGHPVTAVGDPCQSIYGWRGASAGNLRRFRSDFSSGTGNTVRPPKLALLSTSFRNAEKILDVAAALQADLRAEAAEVPRLVPATGRSGRGMAACALLPTAAGEAEWIAERLTRLLSMPPGVAPDGRPWPDGRKDRVRPSDIAVLCRKRSQFPVLRRAIEERGIPIEVVGLGGLLTVPEVQDVVATLRVMHDPAASDAVARLLTGPRWRIGPADLVALGRRARALAAASSPRRGGADTGTPPGGEGDAPVDPVSEAIADMTAESASLVEALDDLGDPSRYSKAGYARLSSLAAELRALRGQVGQPLPDLVLEVERVLGLDIEVAARPGADPAAARADLDAFADAAAAFAGDDEEPTLGAFLSYLTAAEAEEFGLEAGRVGESDSVKLMTVHAAKGLQWPAVFVPGLAAGEKAQLFPAKPRVSTRWTDNPRKLPFGLRGDAVDLPGLGGLDETSLEAFTRAAKERDLREERRLVYVATTRAAFWLGCSGFWWGDGTAPLGPSIFLQEVRAACEAGAGRVSSWAPAPDEGAENPVLVQEQTAPWPASPSGSRYDAAVAAAAMVEDQIAALAGASPRAPAPAPGPAERADPSKHTDSTPLNEADRALIAAWQRDASLLLAERAARRGQEAVPVDLPSRLSVSSLVSMARDPDEFARYIRRPMPQPPAPQARRGTAFHRWLETRFGQQHLLDPGELPGAADEWVEAEDTDQLDLRARFEDGEWADRVPAEVEVPFETVIGDRLVRGRIDAVFRDGAGGFDVVDWKTGRSPHTAEESEAVAVQLAAYRLAWANLANVPLAKVRAAFYYVREDLTVRPADVLDEAGLEALVMGVPAP